MMILNEKVKDFPIRFYETPNGYIEYESAYMHGIADTVEDALHKILKDQIDLLYDLHLYDDVEGVSIGAYKVADRPVKSKGRTFLGQLSVKVDLYDDVSGDNTLMAASKKKTKIAAVKAHQKAVKSYWKEQNRKQFISNLKRFLEKIFKIKLENRRYTMDITKQYVKQFMNESKKAVKFEDADPWTFDPRAQAFSENPSLYYESDDGSYVLLAYSAYDKEYVLEVNNYDYGELPEYTQSFSTMDELKEAYFAVVVEDYGIDIPDPDFSKLQEFVEKSESAVNEASKFYTFHIPCVASVVVNADSEDLARELLHRNPEIELTEYLEFANGDIELRALDFSESPIESLDADEFDPEI